MKLGLSVSGTGKISQVLRNLGKIAEPARLKRALLKSGAVVADEMVRRVRKRTGTLAADIGVVELKDNTGTTGAVSVGPRSRVLYHQARLLQDGHLRKNKRTGNVSHIPGYAFVQPAIDSKGAEAEAVFAEEIAKGVEGLA